MQLQVMNSPFDQEQAELLNKVLPSLTEPQQIWLSGYLAALGKAAPALAVHGALPTIGNVAVQAASSAAFSREATILYGSQTGNSQRLAKELSGKLESAGYQVALSAMRDFKPNSLKKVRNLFVLVSTHGEGDPPDNAISFFEFLHSKRAPKLEELQYSVLALGDTSYENFCQTGKDFDRRLEELGGKRVAARVDCDVDFDDAAAGWMEDVLQELSKLEAAVSPAVNSSATSAKLTVLSGSKGQSAYSRTKPFHAEIIDNINLNGRGSDRETRHLVLSLENSQLTYEPGDCIGIYPENHPLLVDSLITAMHWQADELVSVNKEGEQRSLRDALLQNFELTVLTKPLLEKAAALTDNSKLHELLQPEQARDLREYLNGRDLLDLVQDFSPWKAAAQDFVSILRKIPARQYSIASSMKANPDEVHLTIRTVKYESHGRERFGVCSTQVAERLEPGDTLPIYVHANPNFKMPASPDTPIIMIGPGTGVAPFRSFMEEREETGAAGKSWLFYGDRHFVTDFLYQTDWQRLLSDGVLTRMDVAFSRDSDEKVYVQNRMLEKAHDLYEWLQEGASVYVCGDEKHMAHDVHQALITIIEREGGLNRDAAEAYVADMQQQGRYQRDVY